MTSALPPYAEVVTDSRLEYVDHTSGLRFAVITMDNGRGASRPATLATLGLRSLEAAIDEAEASGVDAIALTGTRAIFLVGADIEIMRRCTSGEWVHRVTLFGCHVLRRFSESPLPSFALINGVALGGGLELALHCTYRTVSTRAVAFGYPEARLGLIPACGGTYLTPHLVGAKTSADLIVRHPLTAGKTIAPEKAVELGLGDVLLTPPNFVEQSLDWAADVLRGKTVVTRLDVDRGDGWDDALDRTRSWAVTKTSGAAPAPARAIDLIRFSKTATRDELDLAAADTAAELVMGDELRAGAYAFDLLQTRGREAPDNVRDASARPVNVVGVVGGGLMASQLAALVVQQLRVPVRIVHRNEAGLERVAGYVSKQLDQRVRGNTITPDAADKLRSLITTSLDHGTLADCDLVIEAVAEVVEVKREVLTRVGPVVRDDAIIATNTSSLSVTELARSLPHPERVLGLHFFNPVDVLPLLEIVRTTMTDDSTVASAFGLGRKLGKTMVGVADRPGFVFNRLIMRLYGEVLRTVEEDGTPLTVADSALDPLGLPMTPTQLITFTGLSVVCHITEALHSAFPDRFPVPGPLQRLVAAGKTSFYVHQGGQRQVDPDVYANRSRDSDLERSADELRDRALCALAQEIDLLLTEGVVSDVRDIDLALIVGGNFPFHLGGITPYLDRAGFSERVVGRRFLSPGVASVP